MVNRLRLAGALSELDPAVRAIVPVEGFGIVAAGEHGRFSFHSRRRWGSSGYSFTIDKLPAPFAVQHSAPAQYTPLSRSFDLARPVDAMFARAGLERLVIVPLASGVGRLWTVARSAERLTDQQLQAHVVLGHIVDRHVSAPESIEQGLVRLHRLDALEHLLPALAEALDVRDVFDRLAKIVNDVLPHDTLELLMPTADRQR